MLELIAAKVLDKAIEHSTKILADAVKRKNDQLLREHERLKTKQKNAPAPTLLTATLKSVRPVLLDTLAQHVNDLKQWCDQIKFSDLRGTKSVAQVYVELDTYLMPLSVQEGDQERTHTKPLLEAVAESNSHCVILGTAGAGKTTSMQKICADFFRSGKALRRHNFPLLIKLRDLDTSSSDRPILAALRRALSLEVSIGTSPQEDNRELLSEFQEKVLLSYIDDLNASVLLDGFDELPTEALREAALRDLSLMSEALRKSRFIVTSRSSDFRYQLGGISKFEIAPLTKAQITIFATRWLQSSHKADDFLTKVFASPFADTTIRPLTIAHLCAIYERIQDIPDKPKSVYRRIVQLLLEDWDTQRRIKRPSSYAQFDHDRKFEFLAHLAFYLTTELKQLRFSTESLREAYAKIHQDHGLPPNQSAQVVSELESHSGLIIESGRGYYEFAHKSLQEYLAADYIVRMPNVSAIEKSFSLLPNELAIATSLSSKPGAYLAELFLRAIDVERESTPWLATFLTRLGLEKPELNIGASEYSAIAAMYLLSRSEQPGAVARFLGSAVPKGAAKNLLQHYQISGHEKGRTFLRLFSKSHTYKLPTLLSAPSELLQ